MRNTKPNANGKGRAIITTAEARKHIRPRLEQLVIEWRRQHPDLIKKTAGQVTFLEDFGLRRLPNGCIRVFGPPGTTQLHREVGLAPAELRAWLQSVCLMKIRLIILAEMSRLTGRSRTSFHDLGGLDDLSLYLVKPLLADQEGDADLQLIGRELCVSLLDAKILTQTRRASDTITAVATYNLIAGFPAIWSSMEIQAPTLMPLVSYMCRKKLINFDQEAFRSLKRYGRAHGLTEAGWKVLCHFPAEQLRFLLINHTLEDIFRLASHFGETGEVTMADLIAAHIVYCRARGRVMGSIPAWFDGAAHRELAQRQKSAPEYFHTTHFIQTHYTVALDWLEHYLADGGRPDANQKRAGWPWIMRQSAAWHEAQLRRRTLNFTWETALGAYRDGGYEVIPLISSQGLAVEGNSLHHCVGSYAGYCRAGRSRIFSIRKDGLRLATAELVMSGNLWTLSQNRGPCNSQPDRVVMAVAERLQARYNAAFTALTQKNLPATDPRGSRKTAPGSVLTFRTQTKTHSHRPGGRC